jgi:hypothetical protein
MKRSIEKRSIGKKGQKIKLERGKAGHWRVSFFLTLIRCAIALKKA